MLREVLLWRFKEKVYKEVSDAYGKIGGVLSETIGSVKDVVDAFGGELGPVAEAALDGIQQGFTLAGSTMSIMNGAMEVYIALTGVETVEMGALMATDRKSVV
mgnify:CR=1 FL=1